MTTATIENGSKWFNYATVENLNLLKSTLQRGGSSYSTYYDHYAYSHVSEDAVETPFGAIKDDVAESFGLKLLNKTYKKYSMTACHITKYDRRTSYWNQQAWTPAELRSLPFFVVLKQDDNYYVDSSSEVESNEKWDAIAATAKNPHFLGCWEQQRGGALGTANFCVSVEHGGARFLLAMPFHVAEYLLGLKVTEDMTIQIANGETGAFNIKDVLSDTGGHRGYRYDPIKKFDFTFETLDSIRQKIGIGYHNTNIMLKAIVKSKWDVAEISVSGIKKTMTKLKPLVDELMESDPISVCSYRTLAAHSGRAVDGVKISSVFNELLADVTTKDQLVKKLKDFYSEKAGDTLHTMHGRLDEAVKRLDLYKSKRKDILKSQANRAFSKIMEEAESLTIDKKKHKLTWAKIESGELPLGTFFRKSEQYFLLNDNWDLWEEMFKRGHGDQVIELANEVKGRSTYEKDLMSYFYFVLYGLPDYLKRHTGRKWTCVPKLVNTENELDPPEEEGGVARKRSALTPTADNETNTVTVPYASLAISGSFGTTYCYSHDYHVLNKGYSLNGNVVTTELEVGLNGRDDYGLMFYTLTGSPQGRGYPTFLIIFERRTQKGDTKVHFHRTHPSRSKDGDYNGIHNWIVTTFNWAMGNVNRKLLKAQQGDLFFIDCSDREDKIAFTHKVESYDKHVFDRPVDFAEYTKAAKSNILGYVKLDGDAWLRHVEHDDVLIPAGVYAIHQCRSWEANPKGVWSLRID